jgi:hypothetical protein
MVLLYACYNQVQSVDYYTHHQSEMEQVIRGCNKLPDAGLSDENCINAGNAQRSMLIKQSVNIQPGL